MLELILLWGYMLLINIGIGAGVLKLLYWSVGKRGKKIECMWAVMAGVVAITVYAEIVSIFYKVGMAAHLILLVLTACVGWFYRKELQEKAGHLRKILFSWEGVVYVIIVLIVAFFASRGEQHTDTGIYHAQAIRWYEEYGLVKGLGNLQQHFAYNSAGLGYAAVFSMKWLLGRSLHGTNGFLMVLLCVWALRGLKNVKSHKSHAGDGCCVGILVYSLVCAERIMSPATDFSTMYLAFYIITQWVRLTEEKEAVADTEDYGILCVMAVCAAAYKLSAGILVILAVYPAVIWIREKQWKKIGVFFASGLLVLLPYLVRNVFISGWLIYPFTSIDLFDVDWKVPFELAQYDSDQIKVWGRCLFDVSKIELGISEWFPIWWEAKDTYEKMLLISNLLALVLEAIFFLHVLWHKRKIPWQWIVLDLAVLGGIAGWFLTAPFIRYGLVFLLSFPLLAMGRWMESIGNGPARIAAGFVAVLCFLFMCDYWNYYALFDIRWVRSHITDDAYLLQQDYDEVEVKELQIGTLTVYYPAEGENISYHAFPATAYPDMAERIQLRGEEIRDGFKAK